MLNNYAIQSLLFAPEPDQSDWIGLYYWWAWSAWNAFGAWTAWNAFSAWYAWSAWSAWDAWYAWPTNWPTHYIPTHYIITATITGPQFDFGTYYGKSFELTHTINTGTLTVSGSLQLTREGVD